MSFKNDVRVVDPKFAFECENREISFSRKAGGIVQIMLHDPAQDDFKYKYIFRGVQTKEQFEKLWNFLVGSLEK